jgi:hypothetical protein
MPTYVRHLEPGQLQFITTSAYRRVPDFSIPKFPQLFGGGFARGTLEVQLPPCGLGSHARTFLPALPTLAGGSDPGNNEGLETAQRPQLLDRQSSISKSAIGRLAVVELAILPPR